MKDLGGPRVCSGMGIQRNCPSLELRIETLKYKTDVLPQFEMWNWKLLKVLMDQTSYKEDVDSTIFDFKVYRQAIESFMYPMIETRWILTFIVDRQSKCMKNYTDRLCKEHKVRFRNQQGAKTYGIKYGKHTPVSKLIELDNADFSGRPIKCNSTSGCLFLNSGRDLSWK